MDQFMTAFLGGYRKDLVDERLKELVGQIEQLRREAKAAGEREDRLREQLEEARRQAETLEAERGGGEAEAKALEAELAEARGRLELMESALRRAGGDQERTDQEKRLREELTAALQWSESLESELKLARKEQDIRAHNRILELERTKTLNQRILELEDERANPKHAQVAVKAYLQRVEFPRDTAVEIGGMEIGVYE